MSYEIPPPPYHIQIDSIPKRNSLNFLQNADNIIANQTQYLNDPNYKMIFSKAYSSAKILDGPLPEIKSIAVFRSIVKQSVRNERQKHYDNVFLGIYLVNITSPSLEFQTLMERVETIDNRIRDVAVSPNGKQLLLVMQTCIEKYSIEKKQQDKGLTYKLIPQQQLKLSRAMSIIDVNYHPSGQFAIGLSALKKEQQIRPIKLNASTLEMTFAMDISGTCIDKDKFTYLKKWFVAIDKNRDNRALITGFTQAVCLWDLNTMNISIFPNNYRGAYSIIPIFPLISDNSQRKDSILASVHYLNSTYEGYFAILEPDMLHVNRFYDGKGNTFEDVFVFMPQSQKKFADQDLTKCIDINDINSLACFKKDTLNIHFTKLDNQRYQTIELGSIQNNRVEKNGTNTQSNVDNIENQAVEDLLYDSRTGQICQLFGLQLQCFEVRTNCTEGEPQSINNCNKMCQRNGISNFWNPLKMKCQKCVNCTCKQKYNFNPYYGRCVMDCSQINLAVPNTEYGNNTKCVCKQPYSWHQQSCRFNCSLIKNVDQNASLATVSPSECVCLKNYRFIRKVGPQLGGRCAFVCKNGNIAYQQGNLQRCDCDQGTWNYNQMKCNEIVQIDKGLPVWGIVLIILLIFLVVGAVLLFIRRYLKRRKGTQNSDANVELPPSSDRHRASINDHQRAKQSIEHFKNKQHICSVCNDQEMEVNCQGPCAHFYHFSCIKQKIDEGINQCPQCHYKFVNGLADLKLVEKQQQQVWTISDQ